MLTPEEARAGWSILGRTYRQNPRDTVPGWAMSVVQVWSLCRGEFGTQHLPDPGGVNDQAAWLMDAFNVCWSADAQLREGEKGAGGG